MIHFIKIGKTESERLDHILSSIVTSGDFLITSGEESRELLKSLKDGDRFIFAVHLPESGYDSSWYELMSYIAEGNCDLKGSLGGMIVDGEGEFYTKDFARKFIFTANSAGMRFPGKPLVEATGSLYNFNTSAKVKGVDNLTAYGEAAWSLAEKLREGREARCLRGSIPDVKKVLALHASNRETSNTLTLWEMVRDYLGEDIQVEEISVRNGEVVDCRGCSFETCRHFGEKGDCFYGGLVVDKVYPAIMDCHAMVLICPNYNDAVSANMMALFNRLTALFYNNDFSTKEIYAIIVSGYSGSDILAQQIIGAMNLNKGFDLPPRFALMETANDPGSIELVSGIQERAKEFADRIKALM